MLSDHPRAGFPTSADDVQGSPAQTAPTPGHDTAADSVSTDTAPTDTAPTDTAPADGAARDIADVPAVEVITAAAVHLMSAAAVKCGLAEDAHEQGHLDLDEARKLIAALAGLITASAPEIGNHHARALRDGLRSLQLAFREASPYPDPVGEGPGEQWTGPVS